MAQAMGNAINHKIAFFIFDIFVDGNLYAEDSCYKLDDYDTGYDRLEDSEPSKDSTKALQPSSIYKQPARVEKVTNNPKAVNRCRLRRH